jgi:hypothetical protein
LPSLKGKIAAPVLQAFGTPSAQSELLTQSTPHTPIGFHRQLNQSMQEQYNTSKTQLAISVVISQYYKL